MSGTTPQPPRRPRTRKTGEKTNLANSQKQRSESVPKPKNEGNSKQKNEGRAAKPPEKSASSDSAKPRKDIHDQRKKRRPLQREPAKKKSALEQKRASADATVILGSEPQTQVDLDRKLAERRQAHNKLVVTRIIVIVVSVLLVIFVGWIFFVSSLFSVREENVSITSLKEGFDSARVDEIVSKQIGTPLLRINSGAIEAELLEDPLIAEASVSVVWPGGINVEVTPREAILAVKSENGFKLFAPDGVEMGATGEAPTGMLIVEMGEEGEPSARDVEQIVQVWNSLGQPIKDEVANLRFSGNIVTLNLKDGSQVNWGSADESDLKNKVLSILIEQRPSSVYDVTDPARPSVK